MPDNNSIRTDTPQFTTPILFLIFNRPDTTKRVFERIRSIRPKYLFVSADGPREHIKDERNNCEAARRIVNDIDWDCELKTNFSDVNQGCKIGVSSGINWFFNQVTEGIILEDDCLPDLSFFSFCQILLEHYRDNEKIMHIGGANFQSGITRGEGSYYFSRINHVWGWATWKRAWDKYDIKISTYPELMKNNAISELFINPRMKKYWMKRFELAYNNKIDTWDIQWQYAMSVNEGLSIIPNKNLIANIGFDRNATHTIDRTNNLANLGISSIGPIVHPKIAAADLKADTYSFRKYFYPSKIRKLWYLVSKFIGA